MGDLFELDEAHYFNAFGNLGITSSIPKVSACSVFIQQQPSQYIFKITVFLQKL